MSEHTAGAPTFAELLKLLNRRMGAADDDAVPAEVLTYDKATQVATCQILVKVPVAGELTDPPVVHAAQVLWICGANWSIVGDLSPGDAGWLLPAGADTSRWARFGTKRSADVTPRRRSMTDAIFIPGTRPVSSPLPAEAWAAAALVIRAATLLLGDSTATKAVALHGDVSTPSTTIAAWALMIEKAIVAAGGTIPPGTNFATTVADVGAIAATATRVKAK